MRVEEAYKLLGLEVGSSLEEVKRAYRIKCREYHPDRNKDGLEMMKLVNVAYTLLSAGVGREEEVELDEEILEVLNKISGLEGIEIEVCGNWIWVGGETRQYKVELKEAGLWWASNKKMWYWKPQGYKKKGKVTFGMDEIRSAHGSKKIKGSDKRRLAA